MVDMLDWPDRRANVLSELALDPRNVRLDIDGDAPEVDIIRDLFSNESALALVEGISKVGYLTHETPLAIERDGALVVVEGNRRIAALKAIQNPFLAGDFQARVKAFADRISNRDQLATVTIRIAPSQEVADEVIAAIHTSNLRRPWSPSRQAAFFQAQVDAGGSLPDLIKRYPTADVRRFVFRSLVLNLFRNAAYSDPELNDYIHKRTFSVSTLARVYESARFIKALDLKLSERGTLSHRVSRTTFNELAEYIVEGMKAGSYNTRTLSTTASPTYVSLMDQVESIIASGSTHRRQTNPSHAPPASEPPRSDPKRPDEPTKKPAQPASPTPEKDTSTGRESPDSPNPHTAPPTPGRRSKINLQTTHLTVPDSYPNAIKLVYAELSSLNVARHPNAALDLIRSFLEKSIKAYADHQRARIDAGPGGMVQLAQCLLWLESHDKTLPGRPLTPVIKKLQSGKIKEYAASTAYLNALNHNQNIFATTDEVHHVWDSIDAILRVMFR